MKKIEDFRIDYVTMPESEYDRLSYDAKVLIHAYAEKFRRGGGQVRLELPIYRWDEINEAK